MTGDGGRWREMAGDDGRWREMTGDGAPATRACSIPRCRQRGARAASPEGCEVAVRPERSPVRDVRRARAPQQPVSGWEASLRPSAASVRVEGEPGRGLEAWLLAASSWRSSRGPERPSTISASCCSGTARSSEGTNGRTRATESLSVLTPICQRRKVPHSHAKDGRHRTVMPKMVGATDKSASSTLRWVRCLSDGCSVFLRLRVASDLVR